MGAAEACRWLGDDGGDGARLLDGPEVGVVCTEFVSSTPPGLEVIEALLPPTRSKRGRSGNSVHGLVEGFRAVGGNVKPEWTNSMWALISGDVMKTTASSTPLGFKAVGA